MPTGNFGNILVYARLMGLPVGKLLCASNKNNVLMDFIRTGVRPEPPLISHLFLHGHLIPPPERLLHELCGRRGQVCS